ncbi:5437_t:CDS:1, partial [Dentiscutata heterogama]
NNKSDNDDTYEFLEEPTSFEFPEEFTSFNSNYKASNNVSVSSSSAAPLSEEQPSSTKREN